MRAVKSKALKGVHPDDLESLSERLEANRREASHIRADIKKSQIKADVAAGRPTVSDTALPTP